MHELSVRPYAARPSDLSDLAVSLVLVNHFNSSELSVRDLTIGCFSCSATFSVLCALCALDATDGCALNKFD